MKSNNNKIAVKGVEISFLNILHNPDFKLVEFDQFKNEAGYNHFVLSPQKWIETTNALGLQSKSGNSLKQGGEDE